MKKKFYFVYMMTNKLNKVLYTGITNDLQHRGYQHKHKDIRGFTSRYNVDKLVWYEPHEDIWAAIAREKQIKAGSRQKKIDLINKMNPEWKDLYENL
jgi:putative endonuclease